MPNSLAPGILIAAPPLLDPNFERSVVLLANHDHDGAFGWVLNGAELMSMHELLVRTGVVGKGQDLACPGVVRRGGPVQEGQVWLVYPEAERPADLESQFQVSPGVCASASRDFLESVARGTRVPSVMGLAGYAGWGPDQLEREIGEGSWLPVSVDPELVFHTAPTDVWRRAYELVGVPPIAFSSRTVGSA
jgi:putative transcriptional regulator